MYASPTAIGRAYAANSRRKWMDVFAFGGPVWPEGYNATLPPREHNRDALYDIYEVSRAILYGKAATYIRICDVLH